MRKFLVLYRALSAILWQKTQSARKSSPYGSGFATLGVLAVVLCSAINLSAQNNVADFYVLPAGDDGNPGSFEKPFKSLDRARLAVRELKKTVKDRDIRVYLRGGKYQLDETVVFELQDSGANGQKIIYAGYPGETATLSGAVPVSDWKKMNADKKLPGRIKHLRNKIWVYQNDKLKNSSWKVYTLFQKGKTLPRSRQGFAYDNPFYKSPRKSNPSPKYRKLTREEIEKKDFYSSSREELLEKGVKGNGEGRFEVNEMCGYLFYPKNSIRQWRNLEDIELFLYTRAEWLHEIRGIKSIDKTNRRLFFDFPAKFSTEMRQWRIRGAEKYPYEFFVENALDYMDEPGEWCFNSRTGTVYLLSETKPESVELGRVTELVRVQGKVEGVYPGSYQPGFEDIPVRNLIFRNLHFTNGNGYRESRRNLYTHVAYDLYDAASAMLRLRGSADCTIEGCHFSHGGAGGVRLDLYAQNNIVKNNNLHDLGRAGITLIGYTPGIKDVNRNNTVYNNHIYKVGQSQLSSVGIGIIQSGHNHVCHNTVHDFPFMGIATLGHWTFKTARALNGTIWGEEEGFERPGFSSIHRKPEMKKRGNLYAYLHSRRNLIEYNELYNGCYALGDVNPMYINTCGGKNLIRRNFVHDSVSHSHIGTGFRTDGGSIDNIMEENIAYKCTGGIAVKSRGNRYTNNFVITDEDSSHGRQAAMKMVVHRTKNVFQVKAHRNVFYTKLPIPKKDSPHPTLRKWFPLLSVILKEGRIVELLNQVEAEQNSEKIDHNVFFSTKGRPGRLPAIVGPNSEFVDPQFRDVENYDFTILNRELLTKHKIKQIDASGIGLTEEFPEKYRGYKNREGHSKTVRISNAKLIPKK